MEVVFVGVDSWNRPIFRSVLDRKKFFGSTSKLVDFSSTEEQVLDRVSAEDLEYFGSHFDCEPCGGKPSEPLVIVRADLTD